MVKNEMPALSSICWVQKLPFFLLYKYGLDGISMINCYQPSLEEATIGSNWAV